MTVCCGQICMYREGKCCLWMAMSAVVQALACPQLQNESPFHIWTLQLLKVTWNRSGVLWNVSSWFAFCLVWRHIAALTWLALVDAAFKWKVLSWLGPVCCGRSVMLRQTDRHIVELCETTNGSWIKVVTFCIGEMCSGWERCWQSHCRLNR